MKKKLRYLTMKHITESLLSTPLAFLSHFQRLCVDVVVLWPLTVEVDTFVTQGIL
jgi:hypothetical protein